MATAYTSIIQQMYVAFFNRPADYNGLRNWEAFAAGKTEAALKTAISAEFAKSAEYTIVFKDMSFSQIVTKVYQNLLNRDPDLNGLQNWVDHLVKGTSSVSSLVTDIIRDAGAGDVDTIKNKTAAAGKFTDALTTIDLINAYSGAAANAVAATWLKAVGSTQASLDSAVTTAALSAVTANVTANSGNAVGTTFTLTTGIDILNGTAQNDTFVGDATAGMVSAADTVNGGTGTDTLKLVGTTTLPTISSIEKIILSGTEGNLNLSNAADVTSLAVENVTLSATGAPTYTLTAAQTLSLTSIADSDADNTDGVEVAAAASVTAQTIKLNKAGDAAVGGFDLNIDVNGTGVATLNVDSSTNASRVSIENSGLKVRTLNITGDARVTVEANAAANNVGAAATTIAITNTAGATVTSSVATTATSGVTITAVGGADTVTLAQAAGANALTDKVSVSLGAGNDKLAFSLLTAATDIQDGASFDGGDGKDILSTTAALATSLTGLTSANLAKKVIKGFDTLEIADATTAGQAVDVTKFTTTTFNMVDYAAAVTGAVGLTVAKDSTVEQSVAAGAAGALTLTVKDADAAGANNDSVTLKFNALNSTAAGDTVTFAGVTVAEVENVTIDSTTARLATSVLNANAFDTNTFNLTAANLKKLVITGNTLADMSGAALTAATLTTVDGSASTGGFKVSTAGGGAVTFTGSAKADSITAGDLADLIDAGAGNDIVVAGGGADVIKAGDGNDTVTGGNGIDTIDLGAGDDKLILSGVKAGANRDVVTGFTVGATVTAGNGVDTVTVLAADTTAATLAAATAVIQNVTAGAASHTFNTAASDILEFSFDIGAAADLSVGTDGTELLKGISNTSTAAVLSVSADTNTGYVVAYDNGNAYLYHITEGADAANTEVAAADIALVGVFNGVAVGGFTAANFVLA